ncbi:hypothetical protein GCM10027169_15700 [Gordonia jinhuaensis]|uniref:Uncharacterized protein n=1 Tax=Gordonia jinhuaensis TaxID=1517702 RepID=A0A916X245_9ACTN|nr:hypothetical protein GCM10011489_40070 [Gordonia jinhuaensis]
MYVEELLAYMLAYGMDLREVVPPDVREAFPPEYTGLLAGIQPGSRKPAAFHAPVVSEPAWEELASAIAGTIESEVSAQRAELVTASVVRRFGVMALSELGRGWCTSR